MAKEMTYRELVCLARETWGFLRAAGLDAPGLEPLVEEYNRMYLGDPERNRQLGILWGELDENGDELW